MTIIAAEFPPTELYNKTGETCSQATMPVSPYSGQRFEAVQYSVKVISGQWQIPTQWLNFYSGPGVAVEGNEGLPTETPEFACAFFQQAEGNTVLVPSSGTVQGWDVYVVPATGQIVTATASAVASGLQNRSNKATWAGIPS